MKSGQTLSPEDVISHYRIVGPLGAGGMGEVYLAQDQSLERNVALKVLPPDLVKNQERVRRFVLEAKSASSLSHPNIVTIYEIGQDVVRSAGGEARADSAPVQFISMELIHGKTLSTLIHDEKTDVRTLLGYLAQAAEGLAKAHAAGIVHRDLKPGNIMVTADGFAKVLDFGLAKLTERRDADPELTSAPTLAADATGAGMLLGTTGYMSPEQVQGKSVDHRSDIFSFGCVLYEALTRRRPFVADSAVETMHKILHEKPAPVEELNPAVPAEARRLVRRCLAKNPDQRLQSMKDAALEMRELVDEWDSLSASATSGSATSTGMRSGPTPPAQSRSRLAIWAGVALLAVAAIAVATWQLGRGRKDADLQPFETMRLSALTSRGDVTEAAISRDGRFLAYLTGAVGQGSVRVRQIATGSDIQVVPSQDGLLAGLSFTPDGNYLFYLKRKRDARRYWVLMQVPSLGGESRERAFDVDSRASFSPDGKRVVFIRHISPETTSNVVVLDLDSAKERVLASAIAPSGVLAAPSWSPDGRRIATTFEDTSSGRFVSTIAVLDLDTGRREDLAVSQGGVHESVAWLPDGSGLIWSGYDLATSVARQISLVTYPEGKARRITNDVDDYFQVSVSSRDEAIAAVRNNRSSNLWLADASGGEARPITKFSGTENSPWAFVTADDGSVVFANTREGGNRLWNVGANGGEPTPITPVETTAVNPRSIRGGIAYERYERDGSVHVWRTGTDGSGQRALTPDWPARIIDSAPEAAFVTVLRLESQLGIWIVPLDGGPPRSLGAAADNRFGLISPDGSKILVSRLAVGKDGLNRLGFQVIPSAGGDAVASFELPERAAFYVWSPDSAAVTFRDHADPSWNIYRVRVSGGTPEPVTHFTEGRCTAFQWSPDGRRLAVARAIGDGTNLWLTGADGSKPVQLTRFPGDAIFNLQWTRDGKSVVINSGKRSNDVVLIRNIR